MPFTVKELKKWLEKVEKEGAEELEVEMDCFHGDVKLSAKEPSGIITESIMLIS